MRAPVRVLLVLFVLVVVATPVWADGSFTLTTVSGTTTRVLSLIKRADGSYLGDLSINGEPSKPVGAWITSSVVTFGCTVPDSCGYTGSLQVSDVDGVGYAGFVNNRLVTVNAKFGNEKIVYDGLVSIFDDLAGKSDESKLTLFWGKSKLTLVPGTNPGSCTGVVKSGGEIIATVSCETTGSLNFLNNPEMVILWLVNELIE